MPLFPFPAHLFSLKKSTVGMSVISMTCHPVSVFLLKGHIETSTQVFKKDSTAV